MMYAAAGQCFCYLLITILIRYSEKEGFSGQDKVASASVAFFFLYYVFFGIGFQGVPWLFPGKSCLHPQPSHINITNSYSPSQPK